MEQSVEVWGEEEAAVDVEAFGIRFAVGPGFNVAGAEQFRSFGAGLVRNSEHVVPRITSESAGFGIPGIRDCEKASNPVSHSRTLNKEMRRRLSFAGAINGGYM